MSLLGPFYLVSLKCPVFLEEWGLLASEAEEETSLSLSPSECLLWEHFTGGWCELATEAGMALFNVPSSFNGNKFGPCRPGRLTCPPELRCTRYGRPWPVLASPSLPGPFSLWDSTLLSSQTTLSCPLVQCSKHGPHISCWPATVWSWLVTR